MHDYIYCCVFCLQSDDVAELEWLSQFVEDSFTDFPSYSLPGIINPRNDNLSFSSKARSKRSRAVTTLNGTNWTTTSGAAGTLTGKTKTNREIQRQASPAAVEGVRRCSHCASEKTPQWRTGPLGPKTLCNACGVRYKSGRLVPEYRPAASPTFVLTQHSNSHRKVLELRRQKEEQSTRRQQEQVCRQQHRQQVFWGVKVRVITLNGGGTVWSPLTQCVSPSNVCFLAFLLSLIFRNFYF